LMILAKKIGRSFEWTVAFNTFCAALGYKTRIVEDLVYHEWSEVYVESEERWVHVDVH